MGAKNKAKRMKGEILSEEKKMLSKKEKARQHMDQLYRLQEKDPEFYQFLQEHDKELLEFNDEEVDDEIETDVDDDEELQEEEEEEKEESDVLQLEDLDGTADKQEKSSKNVITSEMVDSWCNSIRDNASLGALRSLMKAFRTACHYGDDDGDDSGSKFSIMSSNVFNKIMLFVLNEIDGILRGLLKLPPTGGKEMDLTSTKQWKNYNHLVKSYLGNALHVLNQMTDTEMISFTLRRLRFSSIFLAAFPVLLRKYIKVILHFWGTGGGALPVVSFLFLRDLCMQLGSDCIDDCFKGMYRAYVQSCQYVNATKLQHIQFLGNCFTELLRVDLPAAYQHAFVFIRQLAMILSQAITDKKKDSFRKVYEWKYMNCLELWTAAICAYGSEADFRPLAYPLTQIIYGAACLAPTAQYLPLRLRCVRMLNRIAASTGTFIPVSLLLLDMLEIKELHRPPTGGIGKAVDLRTVLKVSKPALKTRAFQEACVFSVVEELTEHLAQWSYSVAFFELSFVPAVRLRNFFKSTKVERFRREIRQLIRQIEVNCEFTNKKRISVTLLPNDPTAACILEDEKKSGSSPLSQYAATLRQRAQQRNDSIMHSSMLVGEGSSVFGKEIIEDDENDDNRDEEGSAVFSSSWLPQRDAKNKHSKEEKKTKRKKDSQREAASAAASDEDLVEDLILSDDEDDDPSSIQDVKSEQISPKQHRKKQKLSLDSSKKKAKPNMHKSKKRKRRN